MYWEHTDAGGLVPSIALIHFVRHCGSVFEVPQSFLHTSVHLSGRFQVGPFINLTCINLEKEVTTSLFLAISPEYSC